MKLMVLGDVDTLTEADLKRLEPHMGNWMLVHAHAVSLPANTNGLREMRKMLLLELQDQKRMQVIARLYGKISRLRRQIEEAELARGLA